MGGACLLKTKKESSRYILRAQVCHFDEVGGEILDVPIDNLTWFGSWSKQINLP